MKSGAAEVRAPFYSHLSYDIVPDAEIVVRQPDILIVEGLNVLQPPASGARLAVSDLFDFSIYVDARTSDIERWYVERFLRLQRGAFTDPESYFHRYATLSEAEAVDARGRSGTRSTAPTSSRTCCRPGRARRWCCARTPTTRSRACCCASSSGRIRQRLEHEHRDLPVGLLLIVGIGRVCGDGALPPHGLLVA